MDTRRSMRLARLAIKTDKSAGVTKEATNLRQQLDELASQPAAADVQMSVARALEAFRSSVDQAIVTLSPEELAQIAEVAGEQQFSPVHYTGVEQELRDNPATPATARDLLVGFMGARDVAFANLRQFLSTAEALGWDDEEQTEWPAEIGFKIPRQLFENRFDGLLGELRYLRRLLSHVSEAHGQSVEDVKLSGLSTTDPVIVLGVCYLIAKELGGLTAWALAQWKTVEEIRKLRADAGKLKSFSDEEIEKIFGDKIRAEIELGIAKESARLVEAIKPAARKNELGNALSIDLKEFLGRIERGLTVEVRLISASDDAESENDDDEATDKTAEASELRAIAALLKFPPPSDNPVLQISHLSPE